MNNKIFITNRSKIPIKRISSIFNALKLTIPRRFNFSGHFRLNIPRFGQNLLEIPTLTN